MGCRAMPGDDGADEPFLRFYTARIEIRIRPFPSLRRKGEERKGNLQLMPLRSQ